MAKSMTGFGRSERILNGRSIALEMRCVNHRYFECAMRLPRSCGVFEEKLKTLLQGKIARGKLDVMLTITQVSDTDDVVSVNTALAKQYLAALEALSQATGTECRVTAQQLAGYPDVLTVTHAEVDEDALWQDIKAVAEEAIERFIAMRKTEGEKLTSDILSRLDRIEELTRQVEEQSPKTLAAYRERLYKKIADVLGDRTIDDARVLQECAIFADRIAVDEETVRLHSHIAQYRKILSGSEPVGRKLDFLTQELNREANTIGSKAQDVEIAAVVVEIKSEIEKIREQIQNLE